MKPKVFLDKLFNLLPFLFVFIASLYQPWDTDLGWHLKYGEYFFKYGQILRENIFSTQMPSFLWPNTSWGVDLIYYLIYSSGGFFGLTLAGALVITLTFYFFSKAFELTYWQKALIFPFLIIIEEPVNVISFRGQILSSLFLAIMFFILARFSRTENKKILFWLIPLFTLWANIHGQFIIGLGAFLIWVIFYFLSDLILEIFKSGIKKIIPEFNFFFRRNFKEMGFFLGLSVLVFLATLIHPYGFGIYIDAFLHFGNPDLQYIMEYLPFDKFGESWWDHAIYGLFITLGFLALVSKSGFKKSFPFFGTTLIFYILAWSVRRYAWSMYYMGIPFLVPLVNYIKPDSEKITKITATLFFIAYLGLAFYFKYPFSQFINMNWDLYCYQYNNCSPKAVEFIRDNHLDKNLITLYGWGGYIIWNYPEVKPSIDGRMHLWKDSSGYSAFSDYYGYEQNLKDIDKSKYDAALMWKEKAIYIRLNQLVEEGIWKKVFEDDLAGVFVRVKSASQSSEFILNN